MKFVGAKRYGPHISGFPKHPVVIATNILKLHIHIIHSPNIAVLQRPVQQIHFTLALLHGFFVLRKVKYKVLFKHRNYDQHQIKCDKNMQNHMIQVWYKACCANRE